MRQKALARPCLAASFLPPSTLLLVFLLYFRAPSLSLTGKPLLPRLLSGLDSTARGSRIQIQSHQGLRVRACFGRAAQEPASSAACIRGPLPFSPSTSNRGRERALYLDEGNLLDSDIRSCCREIRYGTRPRHIRLVARASSKLQ